MQSLFTLTAGFLAVAAALQEVPQQEGYLGFNSGATLPDNRAKEQSDFEQEFRTAQNLVNAPGLFNSVRLYTNIQAYSTNTPIAAIPAAIATETYMLLGIWASGTDNIDNELAALTAAIEQYGEEFTDLVIGISVGSEDLYRASEIGIRNKAGIGNGPEELISFIEQVREAIADTPLNGKPVGHVDTSTAWFNESNAGVIAASDFIGMDTYPYYQKEMDNSYDKAEDLWIEAYNKTLAAAGDTPVWITEIGWPHEGPVSGEAEASVEYAQAWWQDMGCDLFGKVNTWWYTLRDSNPANKEKFSITENLSETPIFDLTCPVNKEVDEDEDDNEENGGAVVDKDETDSEDQNSGQGNGQETGDDQDNEDTQSRDEEDSTATGGSTASTTGTAGGSTNSPLSNENSGGFAILPSFTLSMTAAITVLGFFAI